MKFENPQMLGLLAVTVPLLVVFLWWEWRKRLALIAQFVRSRLLAHLTVGVSRTRQKIRLGLLVGAVASLFLALARPQWGMAWEEVKSRGLDIVVALDTSRSMLAPDVAPNRFSRAKLAVLDLQHLAKADRLGLVAFAGSAFLQCPLTLDEDAFRQSVEAVSVGIIPQGGTALAEAIEAGLAAFKSEEENDKVMVLFTDGEDHENGAVAAAEKAATAGVHLFTIGIGTTDGELLPLTPTNSPDRFVKDPEGNVVKSRLNETLLQQVATAGRGFHLPLRGAGTIETLYEKGLAPLLPKFTSSHASLDARLIQRPQERFQWPLALAGTLLILELFLPDRKLARRKPTAPVPSLQRTLALALLLVSTRPASASPTRAWQQYNKGQYEAAQREYERLLQRHPEDPRLHYNAGTAAYQAQEFTTATNHFSRALTASDLALQQEAFYNLGNSLYRMGEAIPDTSRKMSTWENALQNYGSALKLNTNDLDAQFNYRFLQRKLEELKQQQSSQQPTNQNRPQDQSTGTNSPAQSPHDSSPTNRTSEPKPQNSPQSSGQPKADQSPAGATPKPPEEPKPPSPPSSPDQENAKKPAETSSPTNETAESIPGQMTPQQARQLLDAQKADEKALLMGPQQSGTTRPRNGKDW
jgi:Ca-activated chloride channel homolog